MRGMRGTVTVRTGLTTPNTSAIRPLAQSI